MNESGTHSVLLPKSHGLVVNVSSACPKRRPLAPRLGAPKIETESEKKILLPSQWLGQRRHRHPKRRSRTGKCVTRQVANPEY